MNRKVIYTAIFGNYEGLLPQKELPEWDFVCFTDNPSLAANPWQVRLVDPPVGEDYVRSNRYIKINPHLFFPDYDISIFIDGNILVIGNLDKLVDEALTSHTMACFDHEQAKMDSRGCIYEEYAFLKNLIENQGVFKDDPQVMKKHIDLLRAEGYPEHNGLIVGTVLVRKHHDSELISVMEDWWQMVKDYSRRDQLSFNYVAWKHGFRYQTIPGDIRRGNGYFYMLGKHRKNWSAKLWRFRWKKRLGLVKIQD